MKLLTKKEVQEMEYSAYNPAAPIVRKIRTIKVGQSAQITMSEWGRKSPPLKLLNNCSKFGQKWGYQKFTCWKTRDGKSYVITRIK